MPDISSLASAAIAGLLPDPESYVGKTLYYFNWFKKIGIDINYFNLDLENPRCIKEKIIELCNMSIKDIETTYNKTFQKANLNKKLIRKFMYNKLKDWYL